MRQVMGREDCLGAAEGRRRGVSGGHPNLTAPSDGGTHSLNLVILIPPRPIIATFRINFLPVYAAMGTRNGQTFCRFRPGEGTASAA